MNTTEEQWLRIADSDHYEVSNLGRVRSVARKVKNRNGYSNMPGRIMSTPQEASGYCVCSIITSTGRKTVKVARLVAQMFLNGGVQLHRSQQVDHIDRDSSNNAVSNLRIVTAKENAANRKRNGGRLPLLVRLQIVIDRFVHGMTYQSIAQKHDVSGSLVQQLTMPSKGRRFIEEVMSGKYDEELAELGHPRYTINLPHQAP